MKTSQAIQAMNNNSTTVTGANAMIKKEFDLSAFLVSAEATEDYLQSVVEQFQADRNKTENKELKNAAATAITFIRGVNLLLVADKMKDSNFKHQVLHAIMSVTRYWSFNFKVSNNKNYIPTPVTVGNEDYQMGRKTRAMYYRDSLEHVLTQAGCDSTNALATFDYGITRIVNVFRLLTDDEINVSKNLSPAAKEAQLKLRIVPGYTKNGVSLILTRNTVLMSLSRGAIINVGTQEVINKRDRRFSISGKDMVNGIIESMDRVVIHPTFTVDNYGRKDTVVSSSTINVDGVLNKLFMLKLNKLSVDKLFTSTTKRKIVTIDEQGKLKDLAHPAAVVPGTYVTTGFVSSSEAIGGYVDTANTVKGLAEFVTNRSTGNVESVLSVENINKAVSRNDKLEKDTWLLGKEKCFVVLDATSAQDFNDFGPAPIVANRDLILRTGLARITSRMANGGIKAVTNYHGSNAYGPVIVSPAAFKGGILAALSLSVFKKDIPMSELATMIAANGNLVQAALNHLESNADTINFMGRELKGFYVDLDLNVSNAYFVEEWKYTGEDVDSNELKELLDRSEDIFNQANKTPSALRDKVMSMVVADKDFSAVEYIHGLVQEGTVVAKKPTTRYTTSLFSQIAHSHGVDKAEALIDSLIKRLPIEEKCTKKIAMTVLRGETAPKGLISTVTIEAIAQLMIASFAEAQRMPLDDVDTYPISIFEKTIGTMNNGSEKLDNKKPTYFKVVFGGQEVIVPGNKLFFDSVEEKDGTFLASGLMKELLIAAKGCIEVTDKGMKFNKSSVEGEGSKLHATIQNRLFGKNLGYIETTGTYQIMLNKLGKPLAKDEVLMTDLSLFDLDGRYTGRLNSVKHPAYFKDASASFAVTQFSFGDAMIDFAFRKAAFMSTYSIMVTEDDVDGDARQFSNDGYALPWFKGPSTEFNGIEFINFMNDEQKGCKLLGKGLEIKKTSMSDFHKALQGASSAKANIGLFTSSKYKYEAVLSGMVNKVFEGTDGNFYNVSDDTSYMICHTLARLCQSEAMDNVKQSDSNGKEKEFISVLAAPHKFTTALRVPADSDILEVRNAYVLMLAQRLTLEVFPTWNVPADFGMTMAQALCHAALLIEAKGTKYMNVFSPRFQAKRIEEVTTNLILGGNASEYNLTEYDLTDSADSDSMYAYVLNKFLAL